MKQEEFEFGSSSTLVEMIDRVFRTRIGYLLQLLARNYDHRYGFNYELGSKIGQYYSNVHATVMLNLFASCLLSEGEKGILQDALFLLRDSNPNAFYEKVEEDKYAWDVIEGPSAFSTALSTYALLLTRDNRMEEIGESIEWLLSLTMAHYGGAFALGAIL